MAASASSTDADLSGLLADTPVAPHMCEELAAALRKHIESQERRQPIPLDPLVISGCNEVITSLLATRGTASPTRSTSGDHGRHGHANSDHDPSPAAPVTASGHAPLSGGGSRLSFEELRIGDLEACFAGSVCESLVAEQRAAQVFDLMRMHRLEAQFRSWIAAACYGTVMGDEGSGADGYQNETLPFTPEGETAGDDDAQRGSEAEQLTAQEQLIYRRATRDVTMQVMLLK